MCDIYKHDENNYQIDGDMITVDVLEATNNWVAISDLLGSEKSKKMRSFNFNPNELVQFVDRESRSRS